MKNRMILIVSLTALLTLSFWVHFIWGVYGGRVLVITGIAGSVFVVALFGLILVNNNSKLHRTEEKLKSILNFTAEAIYGIDPDGICTFANKSCIEILGYKSENDLIGKNMHDLLHRYNQDGTEVFIGDCAIHGEINEGRQINSGEAIFYKADGSSFNVEYKSSPYRLNGKVTGAVINFSDITEKKKAEERIKYLTYHDPITGLYNQTYMFDYIKTLENKDNLPLSVIVGDINGLKLTNDIFGHEAGDKLLRLIGDVLKSTAGSDRVVARVGGDEFVILLPETDSKSSNALMSILQTEVEKIEYRVIRGSISLGSATRTSLKEDYSEVLKEAETNMYKNKSIRQKKNHRMQLEYIINTLHSRVERERIHSENVGLCCMKIARELGLSNDEAQRLRQAGYYHDIGKIAIKQDILQRQVDDSEEEYIEVKRHTTVGYRILSLFNETMDIAKGALDHHERWNGSGFPKGISKDEISLAGRIIAVAEAYDFMTNPHGRRKLDKETATREIKAKSGIEFDPEVVNAFLKSVDQSR